MQRKFLISGALFGMIAVITGAFAAHGLKPLLSQEAITSFETGVRYQMYHALLMLILGSSNILPNKILKPIFYLLLLGVVLFSGSIYALATNNLSVINFKSIALITPLGGTLLILSWGLILRGFIKLKMK